MMRNHSHQMRQIVLAARTNRELKTAFRRLANSQGLTESELLRQLAESAVAAAARAERR